MIILGIVDSHNASACIAIDGKIVAAVQEERFTKRKTEVGFPRNSIDYVVKEAGIKKEDIDLVGIANYKYNPGQMLIKREANFTIQDYIREQYDYWLPKLSGKPFKPYQELYPQYYHPEKLPYDFGKMDLKVGSAEEFYKVRIKTIANYLNIDVSKVVHVPHHHAHAYYAYFASPIRDEDTAVVTADGWGDGFNSIIGSFSKNDFNFVWGMTGNQLARMYRYITLLLGMRPLEHEFKVMGLAPYAMPYHYEPVIKELEGLLKVDGLEVVMTKKEPDWYFCLKDRLEGHRFDGIAGGAQIFLERILCKWFSNIAEHMGIRKFVFSGGTSMNIKANMEILGLDCIDYLGVPASGSDESISIGVCYYLMKEKYGVIGEPLTHMYLGPDINEDEIKRVINCATLRDFEVVDKISNKYIAERLVEGDIVGVARGRMEFGARALGNRSILADPRSSETVRKINTAIKRRDFWMPFAPTIKDTYLDEVLINDKNVYSPFMTVGFRTKEKAKETMIAALHPWDFTARPQMLREEVNRDYYEVITEFEKMTGVGAVLNTSLNLHGTPIVTDVKDSVKVFLNSDLDMIVLNDIAIKRRRDGRSRVREESSAEPVVSKKAV